MRIKFKDLKAVVDGMYYKAITDIANSDVEVSIESVDFDKGRLIDVMKFTANIQADPKSNPKLIEGELYSSGENVSPAITVRESLKEKI